MERINLYYPSINIPDGNWLKSSILYSDKVSSIIPFEDLDDKRLNDDSKLLIDENLYHPIYIADFLFKFEEEYQQASQEFRNIIESNEFQATRKKMSTVKWDDPGGTSKYMLYTEKFDQNTASYLDDKKLLVRGNEGIFSVEKNTSIIYMTFLANFISSKFENGELLASTDRLEYERLGQAVSDNKIPSKRLIMENCLPVPSENVQLKDIIKFKAKRRHELIKFRKVIDTLESDLGKLESKQEQQRRMVQFKEEIELELFEMQQLLKDSKIEFAFNSFSSLLNFKQKEIVGTLASAGLVIANLPLIGLGVGGLMLVGTLVNDWRKLKNKANSGRISYLYNAQKEGIFKNI